MIRQRPPSLAKAVVAFAESLPLPQKSVDAALAVLTAHHWRDRVQAFSEIRRVARRRAVFVTHDPSSGFAWLDDYFPALGGETARRDPPLDEFNTLSGAVAIEPLLIPADCTDGFTGAYWRRPEAYLDPATRANMSPFALLDIGTVAEGVQRLERDLRSRSWHRRYGHILEIAELDIGYRIVRAEFTSPIDGAPHQ
jgi:SAM-dependent methyltransferase